MYANQISKLLLVAGLAVASSVMLADQAEGANVFACIKENLLNRIASNLVANSEMIAEYKQAVELASSRFEGMMGSEEVKKMDEKEKENLFLKLVAEELGKLKDRIQSSEAKQNPEEILDPNTKACLDDESYNTDMWYHWDPNELSEREDDEELFSQLAGLEEEMGFALDEQTRDALKARTKTVLTDILNNEARQIAISILTAYLSGGSASIIAGPILSGLKVKVVEFLLNSVIDVVSQIMGHKIEIKPAEQLASSSPPTVAP